MDTALEPALSIRPQPQARDGFDRSPLVVFYETTRACDLVCAHCRACAQPVRHNGELTLQEARALLDDLASFPDPPLVVLTGGDPMKRPDLHEIVAHGVENGLTMAMTPSATPLVTPDALLRLADAGLSRLAVSIDGATEESHDGLRGVPGSFRRSFEILRDARACGLSLQVNTTVHRGNVDELLDLANLLDDCGIVLWSVFFLVPVGRALADQRISPERYEEVFALLAQEARRRSYVIKTTEAPHYRRFVMQQRKRDRRSGASRQGESVVPVGMMGTNDGKGVMFVSHTGMIQPSGFLPLTCGRFPRDSTVDIYQRHAMFRALRDPDRLDGKCGVCEFRSLCGGSRARAYGLTGVAFASDPDCAYEPPVWIRNRRREAQG